MNKIKIRRRDVDLSGVSFSDSVPALLQRIYTARGLNCDADLEHTLAKLPKPTELKGIETAVQLLVVALGQQQSVLIVGDFDCDGATSTTVAMLALRAMGLQNLNYLVPNRFEYGYGLTPEIVELAAQNKPDLIVTVDNGISSIAGVALANKLGIKVLVTDHHLPGTESPDAAAIVNPNQHGCSFPSKNLAGVGVIFYLLSALRAQLRQNNWFVEQGLAEPNMASYLDIVALGTVADVVALDDVNRQLVYQGLQRIRAGKTRPGILALLAVAGKDYRKAVASDFGFAVGPRLNAAGRLDDISHGIECLLTDRPELAREYAQELDGLNRDRKLIETDMQREALTLVDKIQLDGELPWGVCLYDPNWHQGVVGLLASRIKERFYRPTIAFARADDSGSGENVEIKGSARSIPGLHIRDALDVVATMHSGLLTKFGGHSMAAGLTIFERDYPAFKQAFDAEVRRQLTIDDLQAEILTDGELSEADLTLEMAFMLRDGGPWGQHFPEPLFDGDFEVVSRRVVGEKHLKMVLRKGSVSVDAIAFNVDEALLLNQSLQSIRCAYQLDVNEWRGNQTVQLLVNTLELGE